MGMQKANVKLQFAVLLHTAVQDCQCASPSIGTLTPSPMMLMNTRRCRVSRFWGTPFSTRHLSHGVYST